MASAVRGVGEGSTASAVDGFSVRTTEGTTPGSRAAGSHVSKRQQDAAETEGPGVAA